ncbi:MAG: pilus assembly protein [Chloroflexi bacterium]|nr:pilus assembly protein [Chloroflexota bacterium]
MTIFKPRRSIKSEPNRQHGQSAVEMALVLPLLLVLLLGMIIAVFMFYSYIQVTNAAREGARAGSVYRMTSTSSGLTLAQTVKKAIYDPGTGITALGFLSPTSPSFNVSSDVTITLLKPDNTAGDPSDPRPGDRLTVQVTYRYTLPIVAVALPVFPQPLVIVRSVMMEIQ